ncbi:MAG: hypothetical protein OES46_10630, partial [Gammaproteobacteria bacterium]|nr:hypothetical protein [Gammaproteobacteria bacterium]
GQLRWLGVFATTYKGRTLFFPGYNLSLLAYCHGHAVDSSRQFKIDHITLEPDLRKWHLTGTRRRHQYGPITRDLGNGRYLWFGMSISGVEVFRLLKEHTIVEAETPDSDVQRRGDIFMQARRGARDFLVTPPPNRCAPDTNCLLHFAVIVGKTNFQSYREHDLALPHGSPLLLDPIPSPHEYHVKVHREQMGSDVYLQVSCAWSPGRLAHPVVFAW